MKNQEKWVPSKYIFNRKGRLIASRDLAEVGIGSRLIADIVARYYERHLTADKIDGGCRLLDLGCGKVPFYFLYKRIVDDVVCVDWENTIHKNEYLDFSCDLTKPLPFEDNSFDIIVLSDVLEHIPEPEKVFVEIRRLLKTNGKLIFNVPFMYWLHEQPYDYYRYTEFALRRFLQIGKLELELLEPLGGLPEIFADFASKIFGMFPCHLGHPMANFIQWITEIIVFKTEIGKKISKITGRNFPLGYFGIARKPLN
jgi:SAM-dependent methyltransferase